MQRVPVLSPSGKPLMPTKPSRARRWLNLGKAKVVYNDLGIFEIQLVRCPRTTDTQPIAVGIDPGKLYTGVGVQSVKFTLWLAHLQLPFKTLKDRMGIGYVSGDTEKQVSVSDANWKRLGQIASSKIELIRRSSGLIVTY